MPPADGRRAEKKIVSKADPHAATRTPEAFLNYLDYFLTKLKGTAVCRQRAERKSIMLKGMGFMKRRRTNLILSSLALIAALLAEAYCFLEFRQDVLMVLGTAVIVLVTAFLTLDSALAMMGNMAGKKQDNELDETTQQLLARMEQLEKVQKASYVLLKKTAQEQQELLVKSLKAQEQTTAKSAKLVAKYHREDAESMTSVLRELVAKPKFDETRILQAVDADFQSVNTRLDKLVSSMAGLEGKVGSIASRPVAAPVMMSQQAETMPVFVAAEQQEAAVSIEELPATSEPTPEPISEIEFDAESEYIPETEFVSEPEVVSEIESEPEPEPIPEPEPEPAPAPDLGDPNKMMSPDDIAALLASMGGDDAAAAAEPEPEPIPEPEPAPAPDLGDPNKMMSPDDIAALLASMGGDDAAAAAEPEPEPIPEPEPAPAPDLGDPNKMMSPDDIAALLASMGGDDVAAAAEPEPEPIPEPEPAPAPDLGDPNKMMSPDDIAALLASMGQ